ncbi:P-loop containing nucleoside triphosphate hydrolase protein [Chaetomium strumarium]|uniref:P-loop containing nucleoside triphosphate hydrolase protein n=1 Tax=Chaetomium strumarium TaxID=1170767 RepID=A0AAJ0GUW5_9PEZI|nr:P-loop containing nucleoside triphosphate hydrolase protein [Chaetomium strumarium]
MEYAGEKEKHRYIFVIGAPGAGKGTLCKQLVKEYNFTHISVGDLLRKAAEEDEKIRYDVEKGNLVHRNWLFPILRQEFKLCQYGRPIVIDGFPREEEQVWQFEKAFGDPELVVLLNCRPEVAKHRVVNRKDGRPGDTSEVFDKRYNEYCELNPAIVRHYGKAQGKDKLVEIDSSGETESSWKKLLEALQTREEWQRLVQADAPVPPSPSPSP